MNIATIEQLHLYLSRAKEAKADLIKVKDAAIAAGWTIILDDEQLELTGNSIVFLCHNPDKIKSKLDPTNKPKPMAF